jgi:hypothetical protein
MDVDRELYAIRRQLRELSAGIPFRRAPELERLVSFVDAQTLPIHSWYRFKEGFHPRLLPELCRHAAFRPRKSALLLDPFAGVGTSLLAAQFHPEVGIREAVGIEHNPFIAFVASTKAGWDTLPPDQMERLLLSIRANACLDGATPPPLATLFNEKIFAPQVMRGLLALRNGIGSLGPPGRGGLIDAAWLCYASIIEDVGNFEKDGRALRIRPVSKAADPVEVLGERWQRFRQDVVKAKQMVPRNSIDLRVVRGDGITLTSAAGSVDIVAPESVEILFYSPPYLNMTDYTEVYKVEAWLLSFIDTHDEFRSVREKTVRSHPSIQFRRGRRTLDGLASRCAVGRAIAGLDTFLTTHATTPWHRRAATVVADYFDDMLASFRAQWRVATPGALAVCVVGNSAFSGRQRDRKGNIQDRWVLPVPTDVLLARLAQEVGFRVREVLIARQLVARNFRSQWSRESILVLEKPS